MAFPGTYNISYYKGDTLEFKIYPKDASGAAFDLTGFGNAKFTIATARGPEATQILAIASISDDLSHVACVIAPTTETAQLDPAVQYVYDVEITKPGSPYALVYTLLTGTVSVTDQVSGAS